MENELDPVFFIEVSRKKIIDARGRNSEVRVISMQTTRMFFLAIFIIIQCNFILFFILNDYFCEMVLYQIKMSSNIFRIHHTSIKKHFKGRSIRNKYI